MNIAKYRLPRENNAETEVLSMLNRIPGLKIGKVTFRKGAYEIIIIYRCSGWRKTYLWSFTKKGFSSKLINQEKIKPN